DSPVAKDDVVASACSGEAKGLREAFGVGAFGFCFVTVACDWRDTRERSDAEMFAEFIDHRGVGKHRAGLDEQDRTIGVERYGFGVVERALDVLVGGRLTARDPKDVELA